MTGETAKKEDNVIYAYEPDRSLREMIGEGVRLRDVFTPERIQSCQRLIDDARAAFFDTAKPDLELLQRAATQLSAAAGAAAFRELIVPAVHIKGQADAFGFVFISQISATLVACCEAGPAAAGKMGPLAQMLVEALELAFRERVSDDGGETGRAMLRSLKGAA